MFVCVLLFNLKNYTQTPYKLLLELAGAFACFHFISFGYFVNSFFLILRFTSDIFCARKELMNEKSTHKTGVFTTENATTQQNRLNSQKETPQHSIRIELPTPEYNKLLKLALQQGSTVEQFVAQNIRNLSE